MMNEKKMNRNVHGIFKVVLDAKVLIEMLMVSDKGKMMLNILLKNVEESRTL